MSVRTVLGEDADDALRRARFRPIPYRIRLDGGEPTEIEATLIAVGNRTTYVGGTRICAGAEMDDVLFDVTVVGRCTRATLLKGRRAAAHPALSSR